MSSRLKASGVRKLRGDLLEGPAAACSSASSSSMFWSSVWISSDWRFSRKAICLWSLSFFTFISRFCAMTASFSFSNWRISSLTLLISSGEMYKLQETPSQTQASHLSQLSNTLHSLPPVRQRPHVRMASFLHLAIKSANQEWWEVDSFLFLIPDKGMEKVEFLRTKTLRGELVLRLSLDSTCKVRVTDIQGVLLMMFLSYKGMSSHVTLRVLMVLIGWAPWVITWKQLHTSLLEFYIITGRSIVRSSYSTHVSNAIS